GHDADAELLLERLDRVDDAPMRAGEIEGVDLGMLALQRPAPCQRRLDRDLAELDEIAAASIDAGRLEAEEFGEIFFMPRILVGQEGMHRAHLARAERPVGLLL